MRLHISYKICSTSWSYWSIRVQTVIIVPVPALPTEVYLRFEFRWHLDMLVVPEKAQELNSPTITCHYKSARTPTSQWIWWEKKWAAAEVLPNSRTNFKGSTNSVEWPALQFCYIPVLFQQKEQKAKVLTVPLLYFLLPVISKGMISSVSPTSKMLLFSTFQVLFLKPLLFLEKIRQQLILCLNTDLHVEEGLIAKEKTALSDAEVVWQEQEKVSSRELSRGQIRLRITSAGFMQVTLTNEYFILRRGATRSQSAQMILNTSVLKTSLSLQLEKQAGRRGVRHPRQCQPGCWVGLSVGRKNTFLPAPGGSGAGRGHRKFAGSWICLFLWFIPEQAERRLCPICKSSTVTCAERGHCPKAPAPPEAPESSEPCFGTRMVLFHMWMRERRLSSPHKWDLGSVLWNKNASPLHENERKEIQLPTQMGAQEGNAPQGRGSGPSINK